MKKPLLIGQVADAAGVKADTVRFYERVGLLAKPERAASGYRVYTDAAVKRVQFIRKAQALGFSLDEIRRILTLRREGGEPCQRVIAMAEATLSETETKLRELSAFRDALARNLKRWTRSRRGKSGAEFCKLIEAADAQVHGSRV